MTGLLSRRAQRRAEQARGERLARVGDRITALDEFVRLTEPYLDPSTLEPARAIVAHGGGRLALSRAHTVVALAGTTGSGKSSLFNALAGAELSPTSLLRPTTASAHACVFDSGQADDAQPLLDWLGVDRRSTVAAPAGLEGLVLLDLPDIDSVEAAHGLEADRLLELVDLIVWVLDPQKYADATVHGRYQRTFRHHAGITVVALNQADRLSDAGIGAQLEDLAAILRHDGLGEVPVLATSTVDYPGIGGLQDILAEAVTVRLASLGRLGADVDAATERLAPLVEPVPEPVSGVDGLTEALAAAAGVPTVAWAARQSYVHRAVRHTGWPVTRWLRRLRGDPLRRLRLSGPGEPGGATAIPPASPEQRARVATATRSLGQQAGAGLRPPWPLAFLRAARSRADDVGDALDVAVSQTPIPDRRPLWWRVVGGLQLGLVTVAVLGALWLAVRYLLFALAIPEPPLPALGRLPLPTVMFGGGLLGGLLLASLARPVVTLAAGRRGARTAAALTRSVEVVGDELVRAPVARVREDYLAARQALADASG